MRRRHLLGCLAALPLAHAPGRPAGIVQRPLARVIVDNDFAGDPDGLVALAHQLLAPTTRTVLVTTSPLDAKLAALAGLDAGRTAAAGARLAGELLRFVRPAARPPIVAGDDAGAARAIVAEALRDDPLPLVLTCGGPLTNVAAALRLRPDIATRMRLVWIGGSAADDAGTEYNLMTDLAAARYVFEDTRIPILQIPVEEYRRFQVSVAELDAGFRAASPLARWLYDRYRHLPPFVQPGGTLTFGDSPLVTATAFDPAATPFTVRRVKEREVRMAHSLDPRLNYADLVALLRLDQKAPT
ncbi:nucleoside hydrolase [Massilia putida]|uniref:nucleoside hydrolase n=1 Tax=Massilia putida TaxID=1141883 RepID=UPI0009F934C4|nr:nucleoside hydrolase [Massilia putida]